MKKKQKDTKSKILSTAGKMFAQKGYYGVSINDIASELGITKAALYYHFDSKSSLTEILLKNAVKELKIEIKKAVKRSKLPSDVLFNIVKTFLDFKLRHPEITLLTSVGVVSDEKDPVLNTIVSIRRELTKFIRSIIEETNFIKKTTYKTIKIITTSLISFVLSPFHYEKKNTKQIAYDLSQLLNSDKESINIQVEST